MSIQGITSILDLTAAPGSSTGTISLSWTEPLRTAGVAPYAYDVRASSIAQISDDAAFSAAQFLSAFSPSVPPAPGAGGGAAGFVVTGLAQDVKYYFAIREKDSTTFHGTWTRAPASGWNVANFAVATSTKPATPSGAFTAVFASSVTAAWSVSGGATDYVLLASTDSAQPPTAIAASSTTASSTATVAGLAPNTTYFLFVSACGSGCSAFGALGSTQTLAAPATGLAQVAVSSFSVSLSWGANGDPPGTYFLVQESTDGASFVTRLSTTAAGASLGGLTIASTYYYRVVALNGAGTLAGPSNVLQVVTNPGVPAAPAGGSLTAVYQSSAAAAWSLSPGATGYVLAASTSPALPPALIAASSATAGVSASVAGLTPNASYFFFVSACDLGCSSFVALGSTRTLAAPATSLALVAVSSSAASLSWSANADAAGTAFRVEQSTDGVSFSSIAVTTAVSATAGSLTGASTYYFRIVAVNGAGTAAAPSNVLLVVTLPPPPAAPAGASLQAVYASSATVSWSLALYATDYLLVASTSPALPPAVAASSRTLSSAATVAGLGPNASYYFFVAACGFGCSPYAAAGSTITPAAPASGLAVASLSSTTVALAWSSPNPAGTAFVVLMSTDGVSFATAAAAAAPSAVVGGLTGGGTYYFEVIALNGAGAPSAPSNVLQVITPAGPVPSTPAGLAVSAGLLQNLVTWNALPQPLQGSGLLYYALLRSTQAASGYVVVATTTATSFLDAPLTAFTTYYYEIFARDVMRVDSARSAPVVATPYTIRPMEPLGLTVAQSSAAVTISWTPTTRFSEGTLFPANPVNADELGGYSVYRSTDLCSLSFTQLSTYPATATSMTDANGGLNYYYRVFSYNTVGFSSNVVTLSSLGEYNYFVDDCLTRLTLDNVAGASLNGISNGQGDVRLLRRRHPEDVGGGTFQSVEFAPFLNGSAPLAGYVLPKPGRVVLHFDTANGSVVPSSAPTSGFAPLAAKSSPDDLGVFWFNGANWVKMYGKVDKVGQFVTVDTPNLGRYQIRAQARAAGAVFDVSGLSGRVITPNGDGLNDYAIFTYDPGPNDVVPEGKIFDLNGAYVADMTPGPVPNTLTWNGRMNGLPVRGGVYVYRVTGDGKTFTGTIVVAK